MNNKVLIVSSHDKGKDILSELLTAHNYMHITTVKRGDETRRILYEKFFDLVVINAPLPDESGEELALMVTEKTAAGVILIVRADIADDVAAKVEDYGIIVLPKPISRQMFFQSAKLVSATQKRLQGLKNENAKLQKKIDEIRLVDRAKCALIQYLDYTEPKAHRYIEKLAMDKRVARGEIAQEILDIYEP